MAEDLGDRTEAPSGKKLADVRNRGQVAKSTDLGAAIDLIGAVLIIAFLGGAGVAVFGVMMRRMLSGEVPGAPLDFGSIRPLVMYAGYEAAKILIPGMLLMFAVAALGQYVQVGYLFTTETLKPKIEKLNPITGFKRLFQLQSTFRNAMSIVKLALVGTVGTIVILNNAPRLVSLPNLDLLGGMLMVLKITVELVAWLLALLLIIGIADFAFQKWRHFEDNKMTKQEVKDERRGMDGDPEVKSRQLRMAREIALQRVNQDVPKADVVVTNPTHFSVAIRYDQETMAAPRVVAKGADELAFRIREVARRHEVPIVERPPLARALYWNVDVGHEIDPEMYEAVAEVLAYVYRLEQRAKAAPAVPA